MKKKKEREKSVILNRHMFGLSLSLASKITHVHAHTLSHMHTHTYLHSYTHSIAHTLTKTHTHAHTHLHAHTLIHTHSHALYSCPEKKVFIFGRLDCRRKKETIKGRRNF